MVGDHIGSPGVAFSLWPPMFSPQPFFQLTAPHPHRHAPCIDLTTHYAPCTLTFFSFSNMNSYCICGWLLAVTLFPVVCCMHMHNHNAVVDTPYCNVNYLLIHPSSSAFAFVLLFIVVVGRWSLVVGRWSFLLLVDCVVQLFTSPLPALVARCPGLIIIIIIIIITVRLGQH